MVLLSFDTEEFDVPREHGVDYDTLTDGMKVSVYGTNKILDILQKEKVRATFFCTSNFAQQAPNTIKRIVDEGHEIAAHGCDHWNPKPEDVIKSKQILENITGKTINGYRQPRMFPVSNDEIRNQGYLYNSSLNPAFIPGRYMHLTESRIPFMKDDVLQIPASVTPYFRFPLFWLSMHNLPMWIYLDWCRWTHRHDKLFVTYFHPWEFYPLGEHPELKMPYIIRHNAGKRMEERLTQLIQTFKYESAEFTTYTEYARKWHDTHSR